MFKISGSGVPTGDIPLENYIGLSAFYSRGAADGWNILTMGYPDDGSSYDHEDLYQTTGVTDTDVLSLVRAQLTGSMVYTGQSGSGIVANIENLTGLQTGDDLPHSFLWGVLNTAVSQGGEGRGHFFHKDRLDWIISNQASSEDAADLPQVYQFGSTGADTMTSTDRRDYMVGDGGADSISGGDADDILIGGAGNDTLSGGDGNDVLDGGSDTDAVDGGSGSDVVSFLGDTTGVTIGYSAAVITESSADSMTSIEGVVGTNYADVMTLEVDTDADGLFAGMGGNDEFIILQSIDDGTLLLQLGAGADTVSFDDSAIQNGANVALLDSEAGDQLLYGSYNIASFIGAHGFHDTYSDEYYSYEVWGNDDEFTQALSIERWADSPWVEISYADDMLNNPNAHLHLYVMDFESGDFGINSVVESDTGSSHEFAILWVDAMGGVSDFPNSFAAIQSDHIADLLGLT